MGLFGKKTEEQTGRDNAPMTDSEIVQFKEMLERLGKRATRGFIYMVELNEEEDKKFIKSNGIIFINKTSSLSMLMNLWEGLNFTVEQSRETIELMIKSLIKNIQNR